MPRRAAASTGDGGEGVGYVIRSNVRGRRGAVGSEPTQPPHTAGGSGRFEDVLATSAFAITLPSLATIVPDLSVGMLATLGLLDAQAWARTSVEPGIWRTVIWSYLALYLVGLLVLFPLAAAAAQSLRGWRVVGIGLVGAVA